MSSNALICKQCQAPNTDKFLVCEFCGTALGTIDTAADELKAVTELQRTLSQIGRQQTTGLGALVGRLGLDSKTSQLGNALATMWVPHTPEAAARFGLLLLDYVSTHPFDGSARAVSEKAEAKLASFFTQFEIEHPGDNRLDGLKAAFKSKLLKAKFQRAMVFVVPIATMFGMPMLMFAALRDTSDNAQAIAKATIEASRPPKTDQPPVDAAPAQAPPAPTAEPPNATWKPFFKNVAGIWSVVATSPAPTDQFEAGIAKDAKTCRIRLSTPSEETGVGALRVSTGDCRHCIDDHVKNELTFSLRDFAKNEAALLLQGEIADAHQGQYSTPVYSSTRTATLAKNGDLTIESLRLIKTCTFRKQE